MFRGFFVYIGGTKQYKIMRLIQLLDTDGVQIGLWHTSLPSETIQQHVNDYAEIEDNDISFEEYVTEKRIPMYPIWVNEEIIVNL